MVGIDPACPNQTKADEKDTATNGLGDKSDVQASLNLMPSAMTITPQYSTPCLRPRRLSLIDQLPASGNRIDHH
jgi:hypothetical protein